MAIRGKGKTTAEKGKEETAIRALQGKN